jgi:hypothetical protein
MVSQFIMELEALNYKGNNMVTIFRSILHIEVKYNDKNRES